MSGNILFNIPNDALALCLLITGGCVGWEKIKNFGQNLKNRTDKTRMKQK